ncbi:hypothetical protein AMES_3120 [Amycolatopsis mediterranei S699]|uniref:Uncharacterized protein n=2 Tax=Amycolatopsis mediterranei TaxID=33910 RepID=A0A0H3D2S1_AMYMU|nr:hypothetical protein [Amycolatopsis mediterranei]ADJ44945.1 hypothetical protein AMED_3154 [Amycolatopsis mediterranei U32]AEK41696.1 hypothetical protein RAM_16040 [Amycolatopsis mediterranei S699]AFO76656.1 hypothetical protein AMES_3120 [Amycolatopsis mediterranei S699]AGT83785.1 hypothetical protein B737_3121 [Amycolatopsis mediterranei RB]KDO07229.1 hypothetical protein DV26_28495 [Amycolatopsis mediterranei]
MTNASPALPVAGLDDLTTESRMIATPWSRMVRGIGLGQYPIGYDPVAAERIRHTFDLLAAKVPPANSYTLFSRLLADLVLNVANPAADFSRVDVGSAVGSIVDAVRSEENPYYRVTAGSILMDAFAKLGLDHKLLVNEWMDFPAEILAATDQIRPDRIKDENSGRHGDYERLSACTAVFLALGQLGLTDRLVTGERDHVREALELLERIPAPFFRGRGGSMLLSVLSLLGYDGYVSDGPRDYLKEVLDHLDRADEVNLPPAFPQPMTEAFGKIYPLLTMLNAIAMSGRAEYLTYRKDRLAEAKELLGRIDPVERTHMALYYLVALQNLGRLATEVPDLDAFVEDVLGQWEHADPGANFFRNGIAYPYMIETAMVTGRPDLLTERGLDRLVNSYPDLDRTELDRTNRPYPFSYALNMLGEIGEADRLFAPSARYGGRSAVAWVVDHLSDGGRAEGNRLYMLDHALISYALRLRGRDRAETELFRKFRFRLTS